jgi:ribokinase
MTDLVVLGSLNMDLVVRSEHMPRPGETVHGEQFMTIPGGKGANQAAAAARLGASVEMIGRVGMDDFGLAILDNMRAQRVGVSHILRDPTAPSGIAMIIIDAQGENSIVVASGANSRVTMDDVHAARDVLAQARYLVMQFELPLPVVRGALAMAQELDLPVILNPAPAYAVEDDFLQGVHYLVVNEIEAQLFTGIEVSGLEAAQRAGQVLLKRGVPVVIITLGKQGALLVTEKETVHVPAQQVDVVDTTAAGDAFLGGLLAALLKRFDLVEAVRYATCAGTLATTVLGAQTSLPSVDQVQTFYEETNS